MNSEERKGTTESESYYSDLEQKTTGELLTAINREDKTVPHLVEKVIPDIEKLVNRIVPRMKQGGRLFYIGAGTSGRLGIVDASECPPTYGVADDLVIALIAGGDTAIRKAVEFAEDAPHQGWEDLKAYKISTNDVVIGIAASGTTPYVLGAIRKCNEKGIITGAVTCNSESPLVSLARYPVAVITGAEFVTGSTRMKAGTAQKLVLNMISTTVMIRLGHVKGNKMVDMKLSNTKLVNRGVRMLMGELNITASRADELLRKYGSVRDVLKNYVR